MAKKKYRKKKSYNRKPRRSYAKTKKGNSMLKSKHKQMLMGAGGMLALVVFAPDVVNNLTKLLGYEIVSISKSEV